MSHILSLSFFNIEFFFCFNIILLTLFLMGKGLSLKLRKFSVLNFKEQFVLTVNTQTVNFLFFLFFLLSIIIISLFNKRFFFLT